MLSSLFTSIPSLNFAVVIGYGLSNPYVQFLFPGYKQERVKKDIYVYLNSFDLSYVLNMI